MATAYFWQLSVPFVQHLLLEYLAGYGLVQAPVGLCLPFGLFNFGLGFCFCLFNALLVFNLLLFIGQLGLLLFCDGIFVAVLKIGTIDHYFIDFDHAGAVFIIYTFLKGFSD